MSIGSRIKERRKALGYSAEDIAARLGKSPATIYRLAAILQTSPAWLMGWGSEVPGAVPRKITDSELKFALWGDADTMDDADLEAVRQYAAFIKERKKKE